MPAKLDIYKCQKCGSMVEVIDPQCCEPHCCGEAMKHLKEGSTDAAQEKHVPVIEKVDGGYKVSVGSVSHPMSDEHYIQWIQLIAGDDTLTHYLKPGEEPVAYFKTDAQQVCAREYCNLHGVWKAELQA